MRNNDTIFGRLPEDWDVVPIGKMYDFTKKPKEILYSNYDHLPFIAMDLIPIDILYLDKFKLKKSVEISSGTYIEDGDILLAKITPCFENGKQCIVTGLPNGFGIASTEIIPIKEKAGTSSKYFLYYYLLKSDVRKLIAGKMEGATGRQRVPVHLIKELFIPFPLLSEQREIAAVLFNIQQAIEIQESIIEKVRELKKSTLHHVFTHGLLGEKLKETEIGLMPASWSVQRFEEFAILHRGYDLPIQDRTSGSVPIVGSNGVVGYHDQSKVKGPGVVTGRSGSIGISSYVADDYWPLNTGLYVEDFHGNDPMYVYYFFQSFNFGQYAAGVSVPTLNRNLVHAVLISVPPIVEQNEIANILKTIDQKIDLHEAKKSTLQDLFKTMLNKLMTGEIRVKDLDIDVSEVES
ncbi:MAG: restriction endonuclease subunit S [Syntrophales bacterium]|nr:restriction endonuclease subunit S [Syntrophales bacterium]